MKSYNLSLFRRALIDKRDTLQVEYEEAEETDCLAWRIYEGLDEATYSANARHYDKIVEETSEHVKRLCEQIASLEDAIIHAERLENEIKFLEEEGLI